MKPSALLLILALVQPAGFAQSQQTHQLVPPCPSPAPPADLSERTWKYGLVEQQDLDAAMKASDPTRRVALISRFLARYPDSDYRDAALIFKLKAEDGLNNPAGRLQTAQELLRSRTADANLHAIAYADIAAVKQQLIQANDPQMEYKLNELAEVVGCGMKVLRQAGRPSHLSEADFAKIVRGPASVLNRTAGFVALQREDYATAKSHLQKAGRINPDDALTNLLLGAAHFLAVNPDPNQGIFYVARAVVLAPDEAGTLNDFLKQLYTAQYGSKRGLGKVKKLAKSRSTPPPRFNPAPKKKKRGIARKVALALLFAGPVAGAAYAGGGDVLGAGGSPLAPQTASKLMVFGGSGHRAYLGCLTCSQYATDSILNSYGQHGSRYSSESIWNPYGQFGSRYSTYSACNPYATDPPVIVDQEGNAYGRLTLNRYHVGLGVGAKLFDWLTNTVCDR